MAASGAGSRQKVRRVALQALYEADLAGHAAVEALGRLAQEEKLTETARQQAQALVQGVIERLAEIDATLRAAAPLWPLEQVALVDRNVLRLATYELLFVQEASLPSGLIINEAVDLAKRFGGESSPRFVNGVLGTVGRRLTQEKTATPH